MTWNLIQADLELSAVKKFLLALCPHHTMLLKGIPYPFREKPVKDVHVSTHMNDELFYPVHMWPYFKNIDS